MTEPTDAEILDLWELFVGEPTEEIPLSDSDKLCFARAALWGWGAAEHYRNAIASACEGWTMPDGLRNHLETALWSPPTSQPTQAQAGAAPLTCEWTHNDDDGFWETACGDAWRFDDGGPKENNMNFCHCCGKSLRIKGKEAGNAG